MNYTKLPKKALLLLATPVMFSLAIPAGKLVAQSQTETKIRLMAEGLRARDSGDLATAKTNFEQLLVLAPNDPTVQRLLAGVNDSLASGGTATPAVEAPTVASEPKEVVFNPNAKSAPAAASSASAAGVNEVALPAAATASGEGAPAPLSPADILAQDEEARVNQLIADAKVEAKDAKSLGKQGDFDGATAKYNAAARSLPVNTLTEPTLTEIEGAKNELLLSKSQELLKQGDIEGAKAALDAYIAATSPEGKAARKQAARIDSAELNPPLQPIEKASPNFIPEQKQIAAMVSRGRSQYAAGDLDGARETFGAVETYSADNAEAKYFLKRIAEDKARLGTLNREKSRATLLEEVADSWQRPRVFVEKPTGPERLRTEDERLTAKMERIMLPNVSFSNVDLGKVVTTLGALSQEFDTASPEGEKGVNIILSNPLANATTPSVNISLSTRMSLKRVLDIIGDQTGYQIEIQSDLVIVKPSGSDVNLVNEQFALSKGAIIRMTGSGSAASPASAAAADPFAAPAPAATGSAGGESDSIRNFLQAAGVQFDGITGASLAYDGTGILVTQTSRNIEKIRNILARYNDVRQVEIEAKFMDVAEGALDELGVDWSATATEGGVTYTSNGSNRSLATAFTGGSSSGNQGSIVIPGQSPIIIDNAPPGLPGTVDLGSGASALLSLTGTFGDVDVTASLRALSRRQGSDLLSAPKVTVLSGNQASITVGQELIFPQSYGEAESNVGSSTGTNSGGSAGVTVTPGTPEDFTARTVGVELTVTPTVEEDENSISLELNPRVTEFEGFVEYGGQSVAVAGGGLLGSTVVTMPSGYYQPIFSTREIRTRVTVWDGATLVMGGLTREEVRRVNDKVPVLGDIPWLGRAFRSKGEASSKRNLMIFVTANLVSPGGSLKRQPLKGVQPNSLFQNPTMATPGGSEARLRAE